MTVIADIDRTWPEAVVDIGPIELTDHYWGIVGTIPYDGHVVLAVSLTAPAWTGLASADVPATMGAAAPGGPLTVRSRTSATARTAG
jgi:hypothetical protein